MKRELLKSIVCFSILSILIGSFSGCSSNAPVKYFGVSFDGNGGTLVSGELHQKITKASEIDPPVFEFNGYSFSGWDIPIETVNEPTIIKAQWMLETYDITYHLNGGENSPANPSHYNISSGYFYLDGALKTGYNFDYWSLASGEKINMIIASDTKNYDLYANYTTKGYSITYELDGGSFVSSAPTTYTIEQEKHIPNAKKDGYSFVGWSLNQKSKKAKKDYIINRGTSGDIKLYAIFTANTYTVTYDVNGGEELTNNTDEVVFDSGYQLKTPYRYGYEFVGWTYKNTFVDGDGVWNISSNVTLVASWTVSVYQIYYQLNGGVDYTSNPHSYTVEDSFVFSEPTKPGYTFLGWFDNSGNKITSISAGTTGSLSLTAYWNEGNEYVVELDASGGTVSETQINVQYDRDYSLPEPNRVGYTFDGWFDGLTIVKNNGIWRYTSNKTFVARWTIINYTINYVLNGGTNSSFNPDSYTVEDSFSFADPMKTGYSFCGWLSNDSAISKIESGTIGDITIEAKWSAVKNNLDVLSNDQNKGTVEIVMGSGYSDEQITVTAEPADDCVFKGWYNDSKKVSDDITYTFTMPTNDYSLVARFWTIAEEEEENWKFEHGVLPKISDDGKTITYGLYPQTHISDSALIGSLNTLTSVESNGWYLYDNDYYAKAVAKPYAAGSYIYPKFDDGTTISRGTTYWFKCEPIKWNILKNSGDELLVVSSVLLDKSSFNSTSKGKIDGKTIYSNNYRYSDLRNWLNNEFYDQAFCLNDEYIQLTLVDNSGPTTATHFNEYACEDTQDKVFLLSFQDYLNNEYGFYNDYRFSSYSRGCKATEWARANGSLVYVNDFWDMDDQKWQENYGIYWTRSPYFSEYSAWEIDTSGRIEYWNVGESTRSVRPAITIKNS